MAFLEYRPTETLYQYSSVEGFKGIVASKALWCSDLASANDPRELSLGFEHFVNALIQFRVAEYPDQLMGTNFLDTLAQFLIHYHRNQQTFCACFSPLKDSLPMWREYGANYSGVSIGFRPTAITSMPGRIQKVKYLDPNTEEDFKRLVRDIAGSFDPQHSQNDANYWIVAGTSAFAAITALKHNSWSYEQEVRFIHAQVRQEQSAGTQIAEYSDEMPVFWSRPLSRVRENTNIEYKSFPFGRRQEGSSDHRKAIERIVLGPRCTLTEEQARTLLQQNGYSDFSIEASDCQIR